MSEKLSAIATEGVRNSSAPRAIVTNANLESVVDGVRTVLDLVRASPVSRLKLEFGSLRVEVECAPAVPAPGPLPLAVEQQAGAASAPPEPARVGDERVRTNIEAPLVGVFYRCPGPGKPPFVEPGQRVEAGQQVAIVEAMKMMNSVVSTVSGTVVDVVVPDGEVVEFGQRLVVIEPN